MPVFTKWTAPLAVLALVGVGAGVMKWRGSSAAPAVTFDGSLSAADSHELASLQNELPASLVRDLAAIEDPNQRLTALRVQRARGSVDGESWATPFGPEVWSEIEARSLDAVQRSEAKTKSHQTPTLTDAMAHVSWVGLAARAGARRPFSPMQTEQLLQLSRRSLKEGIAEGKDPTICAVALSGMWCAHGRVDERAWPAGDQAVSAVALESETTRELYAKQRQLLSSMQAK